MPSKGGGGGCESSPIPGQSCAKKLNSVPEHLRVCDHGNIANRTTVKW